MATRDTGMTRDTGVTRLTLSCDGEVNYVVKEAVLSDSNDSGRVVGVCVNRRHAVISRSKTIRDLGTKDAVGGGFIQTLEKVEVGGVEDVWRIKVAHLLNNNVGMRDQNALAVHLLRCRIIVLLSICEEAGIHVLDSDRGGESLVGWNGREVYRVGELG